VLQRLDFGLLGEVIKTRNLVARLVVAGHFYRPYNVCIDQVERVATRCDDSYVRSFGHTSLYIRLAHASTILLRIVYTGRDMS
jgi:hypothetical protein